MTDESLNLPELPEAVAWTFWRRIYGGLKECMARNRASDAIDSELMYSAEQMRAYVLADRALNRRTPQPDKAGVGFVMVPADALQTEARRLRYRADECGLPGRTDAGTQIVATAKQLEAWAATPPPPGAGEDRRDGELLAAAKAVKPYLDGSHSEAARYRNAAFTTRAQLLREEADAIEAKDSAISRFAAAIDAAMRGEGNG
jgi:hypothetical protein